jgi:hypothetical protein
MNIGESAIIAIDTPLSERILVEQPAWKASGKQAKAAISGRLTRPESVLRPLSQHPGRHAAMVLNDRGLQRIDQSRVHLSGNIQQHCLIY